MFKKLTLVGIVIAAMAALAPATAGATQLTDGGVAVEEEEVVILTQDPSFPVIQEWTTLGTIECAAMEALGVVTKNSDAEVEVTLIEGFAKPCSVNGEPGIVISSIEGTISSDESERGEADLEFVAKIPNVSSPFVFRTSPPANFVLGAGSDAIEITESDPAELLSEPAWFETSLFGRFLLESADGTPLVMS